MSARSARPVFYFVSGRCLACGRFCIAIEVHTRVCTTCTARDDVRAGVLRRARRARGAVSRTLRRVMALLVSVAALYGAGFVLGVHL